MKKDILYDWPLKASSLVCAKKVLQSDVNRLVLEASKAHQLDAVARVFSHQNYRVWGMFCKAKRKHGIT